MWTRGAPPKARWMAAPGPAGSSRQASATARSEEHTSELQSLAYLVCRLLLEKKKIKDITDHWDLSVHHADTRISQICADKLRLGLLRWRRLTSTTKHATRGPGLEALDLNSL